jgi:hypothetical protein
MMRRRQFIPLSYSMRVPENPTFLLFGRGSRFRKRNVPVLTGSAEDIAKKRRIVTRGTVQPIDGLQAGEPKTTQAASPRRS